MKKSLFAMTISLAFVGLMAYAAQITSEELVADTPKNVLDHRANVTEITVANASTDTIATVQFVDNAGTDLTHVIPEHITRSSTVGSITNVFKTTLGTLQTNIQTGIITTVVTNTATTNDLPRVAVFSVPPNGQVTKSIDLNLIHGLAVTSSEDATVTVTHSPAP